jgi:hypothetical protein
VDKASGELPSRTVLRVVFSSVNEKVCEKQQPGRAFVGKLGQICTFFEVKCGILAPNLGIDPKAPEKAASEADGCAPFL